MITGSLPAGEKGFRYCKHIHPVNLQIVSDPHITAYLLCLALLHGKYSNIKSVDEYLVSIADTQGFDHDIWTRYPAD